MFNEKVYGARCIFGKTPTKMPRHNSEMEIPFSFSNKQDSNDAKFLLTTALQKLLFGSSSATDIIKYITPMVQDPSQAGVFIEAVTVLDKLVYNQTNPEYVKKFVNVLQNVSQLLPSQVLQERLEFELLEEAKVVPSKKAFAQRYVKVKTKMFYRQQKFNLLREETEGSAKLVTMLNDIPTHLSTNELFRNVQSLIGTFYLDPNRVLDIILTSFEFNLDKIDLFVGLVKLYLNFKKIPSSVLVQLVGRSFLIASNDTFNETNEDLKNLYQVAAILIKEEMIDIGYLYPYLTPSDSSIDKAIAEETKDSKAVLKSLGFSSTASDDGSAPPASSSTSILSMKWIDKIVGKYADNQKVLLLAALIDQECIPQALDLIQHLSPAFAMGCSSVTDSLIKFITMKLEPFSPLIQPHDNSSPFAVNDDLWKMLAEDILPLCDKIGTFFGFYPKVLGVILKILSRFISKYPGDLPEKMESADKRKHPHDVPATFSNADTLFYQILTSLDEFILPSLSLHHGNCALANNVWEVLKMLHYQHRFQLYGSWMARYSSDPILAHLKVAVSERTRYLLKRITKDNCTTNQGRELAKLSHANPLVYFEMLLSTIQRFPDQTQWLVETLKCCSYFGHDVLVFIVLRAISDPERNTMKSSDVHISEWLRSVCTFVGEILKRYPNMVELVSLLQFVCNRLKEHSTNELYLLIQIVTALSGIESLDLVTDDQLEAMQGGDLLRQEGAYFSGQISTTAGKRCTLRLKEVLVQNDLAIPLCLLMLKNKQSLIDSSSDIHLKVICALLDQCQSAFIQYTTFLQSYLTQREWEKLPSLRSLVLDYGLAPESAFHCLRHFLHLQINQAYVDKTKKIESESEKTDLFVRQSRIVHDLLVATIKEFPSLTTDPFTPLSTSAPEDLSTSKTDISAPLDALQPDLYVFFWSHGLSDIAVPSSTYAKQVDKIDKEIKKLNETLSTNPNDKAKKREKEKAQLRKDRLIEEKKNQEDHVSRLTAQLSTWKDRWFKTWTGDTMLYLLQHCCIPRALFSTNDAIYSARFIASLHQLEFTNFSTVHCFDKIFGDIMYLMCGLTEAEVHRYGFFLRECLQLVHRWHSSKEVYSKECSKRFIVNAQAALDYEGYRRLCHKWHIKMCRSLIACFSISLAGQASQNWIEIRNALILISRIVPVFPRIISHGTALTTHVHKLVEAEKDSRPDLYQLAIATEALLQKRKPSWIQEDAFHKMKEKPAPSSMPAPRESPKPEKAPPKKSSRAPSPSSATSSSSKPHRSSSSERDSRRRASASNTESSSATPPQSSSRRSDKPSSASRTVTARRIVKR